MISLCHSRLSPRGKIDLGKQISTSLPFDKHFYFGCVSLSETQAELVNEGFANKGKRKKQSFCTPWIKRSYLTLRRKAWQSDLCQRISTRRCLAFRLHNSYDVVPLNFKNNGFGCCDYFKLHKLRPWALADGKMYNIVRKNVMYTKKPVIFL